MSHVTAFASPAGLGAANSAWSVPRVGARPSPWIAPLPVSSLGARVQPAQRPLDLTVSAEKSSASDEVKALLEAAARAREEAAEMEAALAKTKPPGTDTGAAVAAKKEPEKAHSPAPAPVAATPAISAAELATKLTGLEAGSAEEAVAVFDGLKTDGLTPKWASADIGAVTPVSQGQLKMRTGIDSNSLGLNDNLDELKYALGAVVAFSSIMAVGSGTIIGGNVGATLTYLFALLPIIVLGIGSTAPGVLIGPINLIKARTDPEFVDRRVRHEAAHFLAGYLCGLPVKEYKVDGATTCVEFYNTPSGDLASRGGLSQEEINTISVVALAGGVGEVQQFGSATGSAGDLESLGAAMNRAQTMMKPEDQEMQSRWAAVTADRLIKAHPGEYAAVMDAFRKGKDLPECVAALETKGAA